MSPVVWPIAQFFGVDTSPALRATEAKSIGSLGVVLGECAVEPRVGARTGPIPLMSGESLPMRVPQGPLARFLLLGLAGCMAPNSVPLPSADPSLLTCALNQLGRAGYSVTPGSGTSPWFQAHRVTGSGADEIWLRVVADRGRPAWLELRARSWNQVGIWTPPDGPPRVMGPPLGTSRAEEDSRTVFDRCTVRPAGGGQV